MTQGARCLSIYTGDELQGSDLTECLCSLSPTPAAGCQDYSKPYFYVEDFLM